MMMMMMMNKEDCRRDQNESSCNNVHLVGLSRDEPRHDELHDSTLLIARRRRHHRQGAISTGNVGRLFCLVTTMMGLLLVLVVSSPLAMAFHVTAPTTINTRAPIPTSSTTTRRRPRIVVDSPSVGNNNDRHSKSVLSMSLQDVSDFYLTYPVQSAVLTCGFKASLADGITQWQTKASLEFKRNIAYIIYGGIFVGFMCEAEYAHLFPIMFGTESSAFVTLEKVLFDNFVSAPIMWIPPAYAIKSLVFGDAVQDGLKKYVNDVRHEGLLQKYWSVWLPAQTLQFSIVPPQFQVAFLASISFFWFMLFSYISSKDSTTTQVGEVVDEQLLLQQQATASLVEAEQKQEDLAAVVIE